MPDNEQWCANRSAEKEWSKPTLQKLPISATAGGPGKIHNGDEGNCVGKGDSGTCLS